MKVKAMIKITTCPSCSSKKIKKIRRNWTGQFEGQIYTVPSLEYCECPDCGEKVYDREAIKRIQEYSPAFEKSQVKKKSA
jgi:YgiT-type zinc finger domain-containing protein